MIYSEAYKQQRDVDKKYNDKPLSPVDKSLGQESMSDVQKEIALMIKMLDDIYKNKSSDEYKMAGDITKSSVYDGLETMVADLRTLQGFPKDDAEAYQRMFDNLHKPLYRKMVSEFMTKPNEKNTTFTALFTVGYRILVGDLSRIYASTEATEGGIVYHPDKISNVNPYTRKFVRDFSKNLDEEYNKVIRMRGNRPKMHQEMAIINALGSAATALATFINAHELGPITSLLNDVISHIFGAKKDLNPVSFINNHLTSRYDEKVKKFEDVEKLYKATKEAYEEYKNQTGRKSIGISGRYQRNLKKYQLQMMRLKAQIAHYDSRGEAEAKEKKDRLRLEKAQQQKTVADKSKPSTTASSPVSKPTPVDTGNLDF